jgi:hypothetical protein
MRRIARLGLLALFLGISIPASAGPIQFDVFLQFSFGESGSPAAGCDPADPAGGFCIPSSGTLTDILDAAPWTFLAPTDGATLLLIDAFLSGDQFEVLDFGTSLGLTSATLPGADCGDDPLVCLADGRLSYGIFLLGAGSHSITIIPVLSPEFGGSAYIKVSEGGGPVTVAEPGPLLLLSAGLIAIAAFRMVRSHRAARP